MDWLAIAWACGLAAIVGFGFVLWERVEAAWIERPRRPRLAVGRRELTRNRLGRIDRRAA